ncbi:HAD-IA family hydrolase [Marinomonas sp. 15G1-11]|uniref:HAD-IA family hydrolase n=1 Tax=Marinomonas phaeophyticola TaxID=3004091 RepID=A0ABT4JU03_9GAMM|nr:HAD-IA family hydrolase [Marinomonas sp. 15G1-11]MCZ2721798.1 HAD-IA family hydrolase [Marinomonas sp. 15G1-11]
MNLITFDLDNTLWDVEPVIIRADFAMENWFDDRFPDFSRRFNSEKLQEIKIELISKDPLLKIDISKVRVEMYRQALILFGLPQEESSKVAVSAFSHFNEWRQKVDHYPHTRDMLKQLKKNYRLAVITNGNADVFHPYVGLGDVFEFAIRADKEGVSKPDVSLFRKAANAVNLPTESVIHIGDNPYDDVFGANQAGCRSVWFNRHGARRWKDSWPGRPDAEIHSLIELPSVVAYLTR